MTKILYAGFVGDTNPSKLLLDELNTSNKLYLLNDLDKSEAQMFELLKDNHYDEIILMGRKPASKCLSIELKAKSETLEHTTNYSYFDLFNKCIEHNLKVKLSDKPGNYLCNNIYFKVLDYINTNNLKTEVIFLHLPSGEYLNIAGLKEII